MIVNIVKALKFGLLFIVLILSCTEYTNETKLKTWTNRLCCNNEPKLNINSITISSNSLNINLCDTISYSTFTLAILDKDKPDVYSQINDMKLDKKITIYKDSLPSELLGYTNNWSRKKYSLSIAAGGKCGEVYFYIRKNKIIIKDYVYIEFCN